ncbi:hypothetical protein [Streptococcus sp. DD13]|uniref:hypothetical protein n=1 Tax=Streptococcus sp. DD13 TaxID=1777881 RepID=UPI00079193B4|nr:hypothetical protein [Streptococcus sp. DD13]KXT79144.1 hypothetical protein STRDD13_00164 [Streptococcus sp. DD13]
MKKYVIGLLFLLSIVLTGCRNDKNSSETVSITAYYLYNNNPVYSIEVNAYNYQNALEKVTTGEFEDRDFSHFTFDSVKVHHQVDGEKVTLSNHLSFGRGVVNTEQDARTIIRTLYEQDKNYLNYMNGLKASQSLQNPDNPRRKFSNRDGKLVGQLEKGLTIFENTAEVQAYTMADVEEGGVYYIGNTRPAEQAITINQAKPSESVSLDYGQEVTYSIPVTSSKMTIRVSPNFVVTEASETYQATIDPVLEKKGEGGKLVNVEGSPRLNAGRVLLDNSQEDTNSITATENRLSHLHSIQRLDFDLSNRTATTLTIKGYVSSSANYQIPTMETRSNGLDVLSETKLTVLNQNQGQGLYVADEQGSIVTPQVNSYGMNFVMVDGSDNTVVTGFKFALGRVENGTISLYQVSKDGKVSWQPTGRTLESLSDQPMTHAETLLEGNQITYVDGKTGSLALNPRIWGYNPQKQVKQNESIFKIRGLSDQYKYVLVPVKLAEGYSRHQSATEFTVSATSIQKAQFGNTEVNGAILDMKYGKEEYNQITLVKEGQSIHRPDNLVLRLLIVVGILLVGYLLVAYLMIKKG